MAPHGRFAVLSCLGLLFFTSAIRSQESCDSGALTDKVLLFDGLGYLRRNSPFSEELQEVTVCLWMVSSDVINHGTPFSYITVDESSELVLHNYQDFTLTVRDAESSPTSVAANDGTWHHICSTWTSSGGDWKVYKDGVVAASGSGLSDSLAVRPNGVLLLGKNQHRLAVTCDKSQSFRGELAYFNLWFSVLLDTEIQSLSGDCQNNGCGSVSWASFLRTQLSPEVELEPASKICETINATRSNQTTSQLHPTTKQNADFIVAQARAMIEITPTNTNAVTSFVRNQRGPPPRPKRGRCPRVIEDSVCEEACSSDGDCPLWQKCCPSGCGHLCANPEKDKTKPGVCPLPPADCTPLDRCSRDAECNAYLKCCHSSCGRVCVVPDGIVVPTTVSQLHPETSSAVAPTIKELPTQRLSPSLETTPATGREQDKPGSCPAIDGDTFGLCEEACYSDSECPGRQKCCSNGCGHVCENPVREIVKSGQCPIPDGDTFGLCEEECSSDIECRGRQKCCFNGCGHVCDDPVKEGDKPGECPAIDDDTFGLCEEECYRDTECPGRQKCCFNGCGHVCDNPVTRIVSKKPQDIHVETTARKSTTGKTTVYSSTHDVGKDVSDVTTRPSSTEPIISCKQGDLSDKSLDFNGTGYVIRRTSFTNDLSEFTICLWAMTGDADRLGTLVHYSAPQQPREIIMSLGKLRQGAGLLLKIGHGVELSKGLRVTDGNWHHVCVSWGSDHGDLKIVSDSALVFQDSLINTKGKLIARKGVFLLGQEYGQRLSFVEARKFVGAMAFVNMHSRMLDFNEVQSLARDCHDNGCGDLVSWTSLNVNELHEVTANEDISPICEASKTFTFSTQKRDFTSPSTKTKGLPDTAPISEDADSHVFLVVLGSIVAVLVIVAFIVGFIACSKYIARK
ncbi:uncharacterized protein [Ptychodera flava]|uniref:uncharacterized protein n=1 Tax=Ptychodera flava TaxID=63121 RepID=UPI003969F27C